MGNKLSLFTAGFESGNHGQSAASFNKILRSQFVKCFALINVKKTSRSADRSQKHCLIMSHYSDLFAVSPFN